MRGELEVVQVELEGRDKEGSRDRERKKKLLGCQVKLHQGEWDLSQHWTQEGALQLSDTETTAVTINQRWCDLAKCHICPDKTIRKAQVNQSYNLQLSAVLHADEICRP